MTTITKKEALRIWKSKTPVQKADLTSQFLSANGGYLLETQLDEIILIMQEAASILGEVDIVRMDSHTTRLDTMRFVGQVLHRGNECETTDSVLPEMGRPQLQTYEFVARVPISYSALEDSVGGPEDFADKLLNALARAAAADLERLVINGDTSLAPGDPFLGSWDGMLASATSNIHNAALANFGKVVANELINTLPVEFRRNHNDLRFFLDRNSDQYARNNDASRATQYGDAALTSFAPVNYFGINLLPSDVWPRDLGGANNETEVILTAPNNIKVGIWRDIRIEQEPSATARCINFVLSFRAGFTYLVEDGVAKATAVLVS